jgi:type IV secretion system protein VirB4
MPLTLAAGGTHYDIAGPNSDLTFCPLKYVETDADVAWATYWVETMVRLRGQPTSVEMSNKLAKAMDLTRKSTSKTLSDFVMNVQDQNVKDALKDYTIGGSLGHLLDSQNDTLGSSSFQTFELEHLMNMGNDKIIPILLYLFNRIERRLDGRPSMIILDEAWLALGHDVFSAKIVDWLKVLRKSNCLVIMATQSLSDAMESKILPQLIDNTATKIFLSNPEAKETQRTRDQYAALGLNDRQIEIIANLRPKREYYVTSADGRRSYDMELGPIALSFVGASGKEDLQKIRVLHELYRDQWPMHWLRERNISDEKNPFIDPAHRARLAG